MVNIRLIFILCLFPLHTFALGNVVPTEGCIEYELSLPNTDEPIEYSIGFIEQNSENDSIAPCNYLLRWKGPFEENFSAYFDGRFFRFRGEKMTEWEYTTNPTPFSSGIVRNEMFAMLLPAFVQESIEKMSNDPSYIYKVEKDAGGEVTISGNEQRNGYVLKEFRYRLRPDGLPLSSEIILNPGEITEQMASARYKYSEMPSVAEFSEEMLSELFPEAFSKFRGSNFSIESLVGRPLPTFSVKTLRNDRINHNRGENLSQNTMIVFLEKADKELIGQIRQQMESHDDHAVIFVMTDNDTEAIAEAFPDDNVGGNERIAVSGWSFARDCGVRKFPSFVYVGKDGMVTNVSDNMNNLLQ